MQLQRKRAAQKSIDQRQAALGMQRQEGVVVQAIMGWEMTSRVLGLPPSVR